MKKHPIAIIVVTLAILAGLTGIVVAVMKRSASSGLFDNTQYSDNSGYPGNGSSAMNDDPARQAMQSDPLLQSQSLSSSGTVKTQVVPTYTIAQLQAMVPASIQDSTNNLSADQWNNIATLANNLSSDKFNALAAQLQNIGWGEAFIINRLSTQSLYNAIISKLQNA
jgi:hypothetical protein